MSIFDELKRLAHPYEDDDEDDFDEYDDEELDDEEEEQPVRRSSRRERSEPAAAPVSASQSGTGYGGSYGGSYGGQARDPKVVNIHTTAQLQVVLVKPEKFDAASEIADHLMSKRTVVLNLETTNKDTARRLLDFLSGVAYANQGKIKRVAVSTYIITPFNVDLMGELIDELENNGLYF